MIDHMVHYMSYVLSMNLNYLSVVIVGSAKDTLVGLYSQPSDPLGLLKKQPPGDISAPSYRCLGVQPFQRSRFPGVVIQLQSLTRLDFNDPTRGR